MSCNNRSQPGKTCPLDGAPVNPILGCKILTEEPDVFVDAPLPLVFRRTYASDEPYEGMLGQGWSFDFGMRLEVLDDRICVYDAYGKKDYFPLLEVGQSYLVPKGALELKKTMNDTYVLSKSGRFYHFEAKEALFRLVRITDHNDNAIEYLYTQERHFPSFIALDNHRLFKLLGTTHRLLGLEELIFDSTELGSTLLETEDTLLGLHYHSVDERLRVARIETFSADEKSKKRCLETYGLHETQPASLIPLVRYVYSQENDLIAVHGKEEMLLRTFSYQNHIMISHGVPDGLESYYEYSQYTPKGRVLKNSTNTGQVWTFDYQKEETLVVDALGRERRYKFDKDKYFIGKEDALHQETNMTYDGNGQLIEIRHAGGDRQTFSYDSQGFLIYSANKQDRIDYTPHYRHRHKPMTIEDSRGRTTLEYDRRGNLTKETLPNQKTITYTRDHSGNPVEIEDAFGGVSTLTYNLSGNLTSHTNPLG
ncbi:MAG: DUF6531 domain-containing protein, partial [Sulfurovum sp.]|nr:DUF6531 domain-containing protein [Sulfurovum sp.]